MIRPYRWAAMGILAGLMVASCGREKRDFQQPASAAQPAFARTIGMRVGPTDSTGGDTNVVLAEMAETFERRAYDLNEGKRLFIAYNCVGCHGYGGGGMGPPLMDDLWIYGSSPADLYTSIVRGRPNGMPAFSGRLPKTQVWQLVAYVHSLSGNASATAAPGRSEDLQSTDRPENSRTRQAPRDSAGRRKP